MSGRLQNKGALITGGGNGIGRAIARLFASEGARVVVADVLVGDAQRVAQEIEASGGAAWAVECDVADAHAVAVGVQAALQRLGRIDILVNNAAHFGVRAPVHTTTDEAWRRTLEVTLGGVFLVSKHVVPHMLEAGGGAILNMGSQASLIGYAEHAAYIAAKGGVLSLTRAMAIDYARHNIRVNCLCPTTIETRATQPLLADPAFRERVLAGIPLGRVGQPEDVAYAALYLCGDEARFITGVALPVDGGKTAW